MLAHKNLVAASPRFVGVWLILQYTVVFDRSAI